MLLPNNNVIRKDGFFMNENKDKHDLNEQISNYSTEEAELCQFPERISTELSESSESRYAFKWEHTDAKEERKAGKNSSSTWIYLLVMAISFVLTFSILTFVLRHERNDSPPPPSYAEETTTASDTENVKTIYIKEYDSTSGMLTPNEIYSLCAPSVVSIRVSNDTSEGIGSGFVFDDNGYIATACHVISGMKEITVITSDKKEFAAILVASDELCDLALLKIESNELSALPFGKSSELLVGDKIFAIGTPASLDFAGSMTGGDISFVDRSVSIYNDTDGSLKKKMTLLQTSAALNPGNSGGPLIDCYGKVVGIVTMKLGNSFDGISFVIPSDGAYKILCSMRDGIPLDDSIRASVATRAAKIGIKGESFSDQTHLGVKILDFTSEECDAAKKLKRGDVIVSVDSKPIDGISSLSETINSYSPGDSISLTVRRSDQLLTFSIILIQ